MCSFLQDFPGFFSLIHINEKYHNVLKLANRPLRNSIQNLKENFFDSHPTSQQLMRVEVKFNLRN